MTNDLVTDQRVDRTCRALAANGWRVTLVGRRLPGSPALPPRAYAMRRMRLLFRRSAAFYAEYNLRLFLLLLFSRADAFFANDTDTLAACCLAARLRRKALYFDAHELFPDVPELQGRPRVQGVWRWIERKALPHVRHAFTVSQGVADEYRRRYGVEMTVVRNVPDRRAEQGEPNAQHANFGQTAATHLLLYQGAVNIGRGIKEMADVLGLLPDCTLLIAGDGDLLGQMERYAATLPWSDRIRFLGRVPPHRLHALTARAHLGLCLLQDLGLSYRLSLPNRIADFAQAGVPLLATAFPEISRTLQHYGTGTLTGPLPTEKEGDEYRHYIARLADDIRAALRYWQEMPKEERRRLFARAAEELNWQREQQKLLAAMQPPDR